MTTMSKLKRKKPAVENCRPEQQSIIKNTNESLRRVQESHCSKTLTDSFGGGAVSWWERSELNDVERIWALTLRAFCPTLQTHQEECIPQLPPPSSTLLQGAPVEKVSDWKWGSPNEDIDLPDLPAPSYVIHPPPVNDPTSRPPTLEDTGKSGPTARTNQEKGISVCDLQPTQHQCLEGHALLDTQSDKLGPAGNVSQCGEITEDHGNAAGKTCSSLKRPPSYEAGEGIKLNPKTPSVHRYGQNSSVPTGRQGREGERGVSGTQVVAGGSGAGGSGAGGSKVRGAGGSGIQLKIKSGAGGSTSGLGIKSRAGGSGAELKTQSGAGGSGSQLGTKSGAGGSGSQLGTKSGAGGSGSGLGTKSGAGGSGSGLGKKTGGVGSGSQLGTKSGAGGSGSGLGTKSGAGGSGSQLRTKSGASGLGLGTKSGAGGSGSQLRTKSGAGGSGSQLGTKSGAGGSGSQLGTKSGAGGSGSGLGTKSGVGGSGESRLDLETKPGREESKSGLECCPMCLMSFPAGFSQMECDGHLAQCLSEMREDIVW